MGRLEKIVVLTVLFLVAVVLGVVLTPGGESPYAAEKPGPLEGTAQAEHQLPDLASRQEAEKQAAPGARDERLLSASEGAPAPGTPVNGTPGPAPTSNPAGQPTGTTPAPSDVKPAAKPSPESTPATPPAAAPYVLTTEGLAATGIPDTMMYTWQAGDSFAALATRYYGSKEKQSRLTKANEGRAESSLAAGDRIWVPVAESAKAETSAGGEQVYVVKKGDVLSAISQRYYGTSKKWQKILDANRDTLASPEKLRPGMKLRIPE